jgi:hypothetical protein
MGKKVYVEHPTADIDRTGRSRGRLDTWDGVERGQYPGIARASRSVTRASHDQYRNLGQRDPQGLEATGKRDQCTRGRIGSVEDISRHQYHIRVQTGDLLDRPHEHFRHVRLTHVLPSIVALVGTETEMEVG